MGFQSITCDAAGYFVLFVIVVDNQYLGGKKNNGATSKLINGANISFKYRFHFFFIFSHSQFLY